MQSDAPMPKNGLLERMLNSFYLTLLACFAGIGLSAAHASPAWLTLVGDPQDATADYIQFDPSGLVRNKGVPTLPVRVSRVLSRTSKEGIVFRSFEGVIAVDCKKGTARFLSAVPDFKGASFRTVVFDPLDIRPMAFREITGEPTLRVVRAACNTIIKTVEPESGVGSTP